MQHAWKECGEDPPSLPGWAEQRFLIAIWFVVIQGHLKKIFISDSKSSAFKELKLPIYKLENKSPTTFHKNQLLENF